jgi:excisionase family DNA binding protein
VQVVQLPPTERALLLTVSQAADALQISERKAYSLVGAGVLPSIRVGASIRVPRAALEAWIKREAVGA